MGRDLNVKAVITHGDGTTETLWGRNVVTTDGLDFYARKAAAGAASGTTTITNDFFGSNARMILRTGTATPENNDTFNDIITPISGSNKSVQASYENSAADDGQGVDRAITYMTEYTPTDFNETAILGGAIHSGGGPATGAGIAGTTPLLAHWTFAAPASKTANDSIVIWVIHDVGGT